MGKKPKNNGLMPMHVIIQLTLAFVHITETLKIPLSCVFAIVVHNYMVIRNNEANKRQGGRRKKPAEEINDKQKPKISVESQKSKGKKIQER